MDQPPPLLETLTSALPLGVKVRFYHVSTPPSPSSALFSAAPRMKDESTFCESHFLSVSLPPSDSHKHQLLVFAIEVLIFTTESLTTIFVSKADSTGFLYLLNTIPGAPSPLRAIATAFLEFLVQTRLQGPRIVLSLFARSQNQYLFPGSIENPTKHVLDDRQLIKWWCRALDPILRHYKPTEGEAISEENSSVSSIAYVIVPGCDRFETRAFFPQSTKLDPPHKLRWICSYPVDLIAKDTKAPPRCLVPRLPDDPKGRFLNDLDGEVVHSDGQWRSVKSLDQFWELMNYRQECSAGRAVGFVWLVFSPASHEGNGLEQEARAGMEGERAAALLPTPGKPQVENLPLSLHITATKDDTISSAAIPVSPPLSSPVFPPDHIRRSQGMEKRESGAGERFYDSEKIVAVRWPEAGRGELVIKEVEYQSLMDHMLTLDFAGQEVAALSTSSWITKAAHLGGREDWGKEIAGRSSLAALLPKKADEGGRSINVLTSVRKKRKTNNDADPPTQPAAIEPTIPELSAGLVRKKAKRVAT